MKYAERRGYIAKRKVPPLPTPKSENWSAVRRESQKRRKKTDGEKRNRLKVVGRFCHWFGRHIANSDPGDPLSTKLMTWMNLGAEDKEAQRNECQTYYAAAMVAALPDGATWSAAMCYGDVGYTYQPVRADRVKPLPCRRQIGHQGRSQFPLTYVPCSATPPEEELGEGERFSPGECFEEAM